MVNVSYSSSFQKAFEKIRDQEVKGRVKEYIRKIIVSPLLGKPMRHERKGTREVYVSSYRLSYMYIPEQDLLIFLDFYHKDQQ